MVDKAETSVGQINASAFALAYLVGQLCQHDPRLFPAVFLGTLQQRCIYAVPRYLSTQQFKDRGSYMEALGYKRTGESQAWQDEATYFERMRGLVSLLAAFMQSPMQNHPHGLPAAWAWLARILNQKPRSATAAVLDAFLRTAGFMLHKTYGKQFIKILIFIKTDFAARLDQDAKYPARRAARDQLLQYIDTRAFQTEPEGRRPEAAQKGDASSNIAISGDDYH